MRRSIRIAMLAAAAALSVAACGSDNKTSTVEAAAPVTPAPVPATTAATFGSTVTVKSTDTDLGPVLTDSEGRTLYGFTNDVDAVSTCYGTCAEAWPPVIVPPDWTVGPGIDSGIFSTVIREDGLEQLIAGKFPLYLFSGDAAPGDHNGQGSGDVWFVVKTDGRLVLDGGDKAAAGSKDVTTPDVSVAKTGLGDVLVDANGHTLYAFTKDSGGVPTCQGDCAKAWPAAVVDSQPVLGDGIDPAVVTTVATPDGKTQLKAGKWPLYDFAGDAAAGDTNGQGSGGVWFAVTKDGKLVK